MESKIIFLAPCLPNIKGLLVECPIVQYNQKQQQFHHRRASVTIINYRLWVYCLLLISRLNSVKNTNFGLYNKKSFLTHPNIVFGVTDHFCIKWTFWKIAFFCPKNAFFWQKWQFDPLHRAAPHWCQGTFFSGGNSTPIFEANKLGTVVQKCTGHFDSS